MFMFAGPTIITPDQAKVVGDKVADAAEWTGKKIVDNPVTRWTGEKIANIWLEHSPDTARRFADFYYSLPEGETLKNTGFIFDILWEKTLRPGESTNKVVGDIVMARLISNPEEAKHAIEFSKALVTTPTGENFLKNKAEELISYIKTNNGQKVLTLLTDIGINIQFQNQEELKANTDKSIEYLTSADGKNLTKDFAERFSKHIPVIASIIGKTPFAQNLAKEKWNELPEAQKTLMKSEFAKYGVDIENLTPDKLTEENFAKIYDKVFPTVQNAVNKFVSAKTNFDDIDTLNAEDTNWVKAAYEATDKAKGGKTVDDSYKKLLHQEAKNGFEVFVQRSEEKGKIIISYRDTNEKMDLISDVQLAGNKKPEQLENALNVYKKMIETYPNDEIIITGHSLGGSLTELVCSSPEAREHGKTRGFVFNSYGVKDNLKACGKDYQDNGNVIGAVCKSDYFIAKSANHVGKTYSVNSEKYADIPQKVVEQVTREYVNMAIREWSFENANAQLGQLVKNEALKYKEAHQLAALSDLMKIGNNELAKL